MAQGEKLKLEDNKKKVAQGENIQLEDNKKGGTGRENTIRG